MEKALHILAMADVIIGIVCILLILLGSNFKEELSAKTSKTIRVTTNILEIFMIVGALILAILYLISYLI